MVRFAIVFAMAAVMAPLALAAPPVPSIPDSVVDASIAKIVAGKGAAADARARQGVTQVAQRWFAEDGDAAAFTAFCVDNFLADETALTAQFARLEAAMEQVDGHLLEVRRMLLTPQDLDTGPVSALDLKLGDLDLAAHVDEDLFRTKVAFFALLNYPVDTLSDRLAEGGRWTRSRWARSRMMDRWAARVPAEVAQEVTKAFTAADQYIADYNIQMDRLVDASNETLGFSPKTSLISHWGLRDELKAHYGEGADGLAKQRTIQRVMERIVRQEIPKSAINNPELTWSPFVAAKAADREPDTRYETLLAVFRAVRQADPYFPTAPTYIQRKFELDRQIPEKQVEALLVSVLGSKEVKDLAAVIEKQLGRPLEPFDIWYAGFSSRAGKSEAELDALDEGEVPDRRRVPGRACRAILTGLGFSGEKARWLAERIVVDPSRGAGHAMGAVRREDQAHLRTRIPAGGMDYKGYNIAIHELGHNVEQVVLAERDRPVVRWPASRTTRSPRRWRSSSKRATSSCSASGADDASRRQNGR